MLKKVLFVIFTIMVRDAEAQRGRFLINVTQPVRGRTFQRSISFLPFRLVLLSSSRPLLQPHWPLLSSLLTPSLSQLQELCTHHSLGGFSVTLHRADSVLTLQELSSLTTPWLLPSPNIRAPAPLVHFLSTLHGPCAARTTVVCHTRLISTIRFQ